MDRGRSEALQAAGGIAAVAAVAAGLAMIAVPGLRPDEGDFWPSLATLVVGVSGAAAGCAGAVAEHVDAASRCNRGWSSRADMLAYRAAEAKSNHIIRAIQLCMAPILALAAWFAASAAGLVEGLPSEHAFAVTYPFVLAPVAGRLAYRFGGGARKSGVQDGEWGPQDA